MPVYFVARVTVTDPVRYEDYKRAAQESIAASGGRYIVRGGEVTPMEGKEDPRRFVILEFPDRATAEAWYDGPAYAAARKLREGAAEMDALLVEGAPG